MADHAASRSARLQGAVGWTQAANGRRSWPFAGVAMAVATLWAVRDQRPPLYSERPLELPWPPMSAATDSTRTARQPRLRIRRPRRMVLHIGGLVRDGERVVLDRKRFVVGRSRTADITLAHPSVSGRHLEIRPGRTTEVRDLGSKNGTWMGDRRVFHMAALPGDVLRVGDCELRIERIEDLEVELLAEDHFGEMFGASVPMREMFAELSRVARTELGVLLSGETGTGKELAARAIHECSPRKGRPFVVIDCGSLPYHLAESLLFGYRRGAFTGADSDESGYFEQADGGTVFLDEIGELPLALQPKLLRVLDRGEVARLGESVHRKFDVRVVAATHRELLQLVERGEFREDLYFRLGQAVIEIPPLRARDEDIEILAIRFLRAIAPDGHVELGQDALAALRAHSWPGNVRELGNVITRAAGLANAPFISSADLPLRDEARRSAKLEEALRAGNFDAVHAEIDRMLLSEALEECQGNLSRVAEKLGITRKRLRSRMRRLGVYVR
jgi:DNA-binding NtrC family response regulator